MTAILNAKLIMEDATQDATITDGNSNILASLPANNVKFGQRTKVVRTSNLSDMILLLNWGGVGKNASGISLQRHNLSSVATWRIQLYDGANQTGTEIYDSGVIDAVPAKSLGELDWGVDPLGASVFSGWDEGNRFSTIFFTQVTALSAKITVSDGTNPDGYLQASRLFIGVASSPTVNVGFGMNSSWEEGTKQFRTEGGTLRSDTKPQFRAFDITWNDLTLAERGAMFENVRVSGMSKDFLISVFPEATGVLERDFTVACKFVRMPKFNLWSQDTHRVTFNVVES